VPDVSYGSLPFSEQVEFFRRKLNLPTNAWTDIWQSEHDHAFVVAGANRDDLVADFRAAVDRAIADGATLEQFRKDFDRIVEKYGWSYNGSRNWRSRMIYETNLRTSYAAGRYAQLQELKRVRPYWEYVHSDAVEHPRPLHLAWNGLVLDADDPWWEVHFPPGGWGCQCTVHALNARDLKRMGKDGPDQAPPTVMETVTVGKRGPSPRTVETPAGIDPGFGYTPGKDAWLRERTTRALGETEISAPQWEPLVTTTARDLGRPAEIPLLPAPIQPGPRLDSVDATIDALREILGGDSRVFDVHDLPIGVTAEALGAHVAKDLGRTPYLPLLVDLLEDPWEVWYSLERDALSGKVGARARLIKGYDLGKGRALFFVATEIDGLLEGWTFFPSNVAYLEGQRRGLLWYGAEE
jgi:hypothetical protein